MTVVRSKAGETPSKKTKIVSIKEKQHLEGLKRSTKGQYEAQSAFERKSDRIEKREERIEKLGEAFKTIKASETFKSVIKVLGIVFTIWCILEWASRVRFDPAAKGDIWNETF